MIELVDDAGQGEGKLHLAAGVGDQAEVLVHELDHEAGVEVPFQEPRPEVLELPRPGCATGHGLEYGVEVDARPGPEYQPLADRGQSAAHDDLVHQLGHLAHAIAAGVDNGLAHRLKDGHAAVEYGLVPADHDGQGSLDSPP